MALVKQGSQLQIVKENLFLDTASAGRLGSVAGSLGMPRPGIGLSDDAEFREMVKRIAYKKKLVRDAFWRMMQVCLGPQFIRRGSLAVVPAAGDYTVAIADATVFTQQGHITLSPGQTTEERAKFIFRDKDTGVITLDRPLRWSHPVVADASSRLTADIAIGAMSAMLDSTLDFPVTGYPYPVLLDQGIEAEEVVLVTNNVTATGTLTFLAGTARAHKGPTSRYVRAGLANAITAGMYFAKCAGGVTALENFPATGWVRLSKGTADVESVEYSRLELSNSTIYFKKALAHNHAVGAVMDLVSPGAPACTANVIQGGAHWEIYETAPYHVTLYIPASLDPHTLRDVSFLHDVIRSPAGTTLTANYTAGENVMKLVSGTGLPTAGLWLVNGTETFFATRGSVNDNYLDLPVPLLNNYVAGQTLAAVEQPYAGTMLANGNPRDLTTGDYAPTQYPGHYVYNPGSPAPSDTRSTLAETLSPATRAAFTAQPLWTCLEVADASLWPAPAFTPFDVIVGRLSGFQETCSLTDRTLKTVTTTTVAAGATWGNAGDTLLRGAATAPFPETGLVGSPAGYRIRVAAGTVRDETCLVYDNAPGTGDFFIPAGLAFTHPAAETIALVNDVLTFGTGFALPHPGPSWTPTVEGQRVERLYSSITVADGSTFPTTETTVWLNFGDARLSVRKPLVSVFAPAIYQYASTATLPTTDYPYQVVLGEGLPTQEYAMVTGNNTGTNRLTFSVAPTTAGVAGDYTEFRTGGQEAITYLSRIGNTLYFAAPFIFSAKHTLGETVIVSPGDSTPRDDGYTYQFFLPPDPALCMRSVLDLVRAAGVEVDVITER